MPCVGGAVPLSKRKLEAWLIDDDAKVRVGVTS